MGGSTAGVEGFAQRLVTGTAAGLAAGTVTAVMHGGRVSVQQIATDAFGNALGESLVAQSQAGQADSPVAQVDANTRVDSGSYEGGFPDVAEIAGRQSVDFDAYVSPSYEPGVQVADLTLKGGGTLATSPNRVLDVESDRRDAGLDALINNAYPNGVPEGAVLGYRDKNGPYYKVFQSGRVELHDPWASGALADSSYDAVESRRLSRDPALDPSVSPPSEASQSLDATPDRMAQVLGYANSYPALARQIDGYGALIASGVMTPEQARDHLLASPRAFMTLRSDYETSGAVDISVPQMKAWTGATADPYVVTRESLEKAIVLPSLAAATALSGSSLAARWLGSQLALQPVTQIGVTDAVKSMGFSGFVSTGVYGFLQGADNMTPAGAAVAFGAGALGAGLVKPGLNLAAGLPNTAVPFTYANALTHSTGFAFGFGALGWINGPPGLSGYGALSQSGRSWWTTPVYAPAPKP